MYGSCCFPQKPITRNTLKLDPSNPLSLKQNIIKPIKKLPLTLAMRVPYGKDIGEIL
jgi:hypothetical protein